MGKFLVVLAVASLLTGCVTSGTLKRETQAAFAAGAASRDSEVAELKKNALNLADVTEEYIAEAKKALSVRDEVITFLSIPSDCEKAKNP